MTPDGVGNIIIELADLKKHPFRPRERVSSPYRSHFSLGLKLLFQSQVKNTEVVTLQALFKRIYGRPTSMRLLPSSIENRLESSEV